MRIGDCTGSLESRCSWWWCWSRASGWLMETGGVKDGQIAVLFKDWHPVIDWLEEHRQKIMLINIDGEE